MKILVTGGAGFIGSNFVRHVLGLPTEGRPHEIVNYDKLTYAGNLKNLADTTGDPRYQFVQGDICDGHAVEAAMRGCEAVVHFAAESHVDRSIDAPAPFIATNVTGTFMLLEAARRVCVSRFVHISSDEVYGDLAPGTFSDEESALRPSSPYSASKAAGDLLVRSYVRTYGFPAIVVRPSNNYGPGQLAEKLVPLLISKALANEPLPIYGDGQQQRNWIHVQDHCRALVEILERGRGGEVYNIAGNDVIENLWLARELLRIMGKPDTLIAHVQDRRGHDRRYASRSAKLEKELGWKPEIALEEGLRRTVEWYRQAGKG